MSTSSTSSQHPADHTPLTETEVKLLSKLETSIGKTRLYSQLSPTLVIQCLRGWETELPRYEITLENLMKIIRFREENDCLSRTSMVDVDVDYFLDNWKSRVYGKDQVGRLIWVERLVDINPSNLLAKFSDQQMMRQRSVVMESLEILKGNTMREGINHAYKHYYIFDLQGLTISHITPTVKRVIKNVVIEMGNLYPESTKCLMLVNAPFTFRAVWAIISPFLHQVTKDKTKILGGNKAILGEFEKMGISGDELPECFGGRHKGRCLKEVLDGWRAEKSGNDIAKEEKTGFLTPQDDHVIFN